MFTAGVKEMKRERERKRKRIELVLSSSKK